MKRMTGFALLTPEQRRLRASMGGKAAHARGLAPKFEKGSDATRLAARKGGEASARRHREKYEKPAVPEKLINGDWSTK